MGDESSTGIPERSSLFDGLPVKDGLEACAEYVARVMCQRKRYFEGVGFAFIEDQRARQLTKPKNLTWLSKEDTEKVALNALTIFRKQHTGTFHRRCTI